MVVVLLLATALILWEPGSVPEFGRAETARGPIAYDLDGTDGPVVLSVHAGLGGADQGRLFARFLRREGFRVLSPSRPGYPGTPLSSGRTVEEQADLLAALLDTLRIARVGVFTASAGAPVAYTFAARHPDRVWAVVAVAGVSTANPDWAPSNPVRRFFVDKVVQKIAYLTGAVSLDTIVTGTLDATSLFTADEKARRQDHIVNDPGAREFFTAMVETTFPYEKRMPGTRNDALQRASLALPLRGMTTPTLVMHGSADGDVPFHDGQNAAALIPGARHHWMPGEDHLGFWLSPHATDHQRVAADFLTAHAPR
ncbi:alpha/beta fold hydrolase [Catenuloplanes atrovinosus]|uniref:Pimeloyl-ACP methyl ester carboxylesterase n=1 Tax=Catenuloplanes atrovinosus TaxID=137266 RepID=A0AAE3YR29_9ACTN|nr:alpha/beta hydrolase [Catenuloplanes atrovinosus]MDR7277135.1 pimeloyl-ACP methyl ester carboxylesterase [Catenuloplanes atrovinosus]